MKYRDPELELKPRRLVALLAVSTVLLAVLFWTHAAHAGGSVYVSGRTVTVHGSFTGKPHLHLSYVALACSTLGFTHFEKLSEYRDVQLRHAGGSTVGTTYYTDIRRTTALCGSEGIAIHVFAGDFTPKRVKAMERRLRR